MALRADVWCCLLLRVVARCCEFAFCSPCVCLRLAVGGRSLVCVCRDFDTCCCVFSLSCQRLFVVVRRCVAGADLRLALPVPALRCVRGRGCCCLVRDSAVIRTCARALARVCVRVLLLVLLASSVLLSLCCFFFLLDSLYVCVSIPCLCCTLLSSRVLLSSCQCVFVCVSSCLGVFGLAWYLVVVNSVLVPHSHRVVSIVLPRCDLVCFACAWLFCFVLDALEGFGLRALCWCVSCLSLLCFV